ncbi:MAG: hypothetical protein ACRDJF_06465, partial [Actinomycetota bacterium]
MPSRRYRFGPGIGVEIAGESRILEFFEAEYGPAADTQERGLPEVRVSLATAALAPGEAPRVSGRHKTVGWEVDLPDPAAHPLRASIRVMGRPRPFVLSLVQGFFIEPLISIAMARSQCVLLPAAGIVGGAGVTVLIGPSRSGKSSVSALALARGRQVLGDDQVIVSSGGCQVFWRRLRLYHDLPEVVPAAYGALAAPARRSIAILRLLASASRGYIRPPLRLAPTALSGSPVPPGALPIARAILLG